MRYAHAMVGGGIAGSRLATHLAERGHGPILLVDQSGHDPRHLALFVAVDDAWAEPFVMHRFCRLAVNWHERTLRRTPSRPYVLVRAEALREHARQQVEAAGGTVLRGRVTAVHDREASSVIELADGSRYEADWVYDSRVTERDDATPLRQTFTGVWVASLDPMFDPDEVLFMDFDPFASRDTEAVRFVHCMPTSPHRALVTAVSIGPGRPKLPVGTWLPRVMGSNLDAAYTIVGREAGSTPLMFARPQRVAGPRRLRVGNAGGLLKASTGYAVQRIEDDVRGIVAALEATGTPRIPTRPHAIPWRWLDRVFLQLVASRGQAAASIFLAMFRERPIDEVVDFLEERASCASVLNTVLRLPHWDWFAHALGRSMVSRPRLSSP